MNRIVELARHPDSTQTPNQPAGTPAAAFASAKIGKSVGVGGANAAADVETIKRLLAAAGYDYPQVGVAIRRFQRTVVGVPRTSADGRIDRNGGTLSKLKEEAVRVSTGGTPTGAQKPFWGGADDWEGILPEASTKGHIHWDTAFTVKDTAKAAALTDAQTIVQDTINARRAQLEDLVSDHTTTTGRGGYALGDSRGNDPEPTPTGVAHPKAAFTHEKLQVIWDEVGSEAALEGVQTYDSELFGWGKGFSAKESLTEVMVKLFELDPDVEKTLFDVGIALSEKPWSPTFKLLNGDTGEVEDGMDALLLLRASPRLVSPFYSIGRDAAPAEPRRRAVGLLRAPGPRVRDGLDRRRHGAVPGTRLDLEAGTGLGERQLLLLARRPVLGSQALHLLRGQERTGREGSRQRRLGDLAGGRLCEARQPSRALGRRCSAARGTGKGAGGDRHRSAAGRQAGAVAGRAGHRRPRADPGARPCRPLLRSRRNLTPARPGRIRRRALRCCSRRKACRPSPPPSLCSSGS
jgi:hypothetical protein